MNKIHCKKCQSLIGEMRQNKITYYKTNKKGKVVCLTCESDKRDDFAQNSFFIIFAVVIAAVFYLSFFHGS